VRSFALEVEDNIAAMMWVNRRLIRSSPRPPMANNGCSAITKTVQPPGADALPEHFDRTGTAHARRPAHASHKLGVMPGQVRQ
jgi:hypothetical protein